jgi:DNA-binding GntR family transcriptional regulator
MEDSILTFQQRAYDFVKAQILNLDIKPGDYITDTDTAQKLEISRTPVREAFRRLEHEGLLIYEPRRGWRVYSLSLEDIHDIFDMKLAIEGSIAHKAARSENEQARDELRKLLAELRTAGKDQDVDRWLVIDHDIHALIFELAGNQLAQQLIDQINDRYHRVRVGFVARTGRLERSLAEHEAFIEAILARDPAAAEGKIVEHLSNLRDELVNLLESMVLPFAKNGV